LYALARFVITKKRRNIAPLTFEPGEFRLRSGFYDPHDYPWSLAPPASSGAT